MATLKITSGASKKAQNGGAEAHWLTDVARIERVAAWPVDPRTAYDGSSDTSGASVSPLDAYEHGQQILSHTQTTYFGPYDTSDERAEVWFQYLVVYFKDAGHLLGVCSEQGHTYLMGDDGGTIDRL